MTQTDAPEKAASRHPQDGDAPDPEEFLAAAELQAGGAVPFIFAGPDFGAEPLGQLLPGERFAVLDHIPSHAYGRATRDGCIGWVDRSALGAISTPTHRVSSLRAIARVEPDVRASAKTRAPLNALVSVHAGQGRFLYDPQLGWLFEGDLSPIGQAFEQDVAGVALRYIGTPYLWGARDGLMGLDAIGLVQQALHACGRSAPRAAGALLSLGVPVPEDALTQGDLVVWPTHAGLMVDGKRLVSAHPHLMSVSVKPLADVNARLRIGSDYAPATFRRP